MSKAYILPVDKALTMQEACAVIAEEYCRWADLFSIPDSPEQLAKYRGMDAKTLLRNAMIRHHQALERWLNRVEINPPKVE